MTAMEYIICPAGLVTVLRGIYVVRPMGIWSTGGSTYLPGRGQGTAQGKSVFTNRESERSQANLCPDEQKQWRLFVRGKTAVQSEAQELFGTMCGNYGRQIESKSVRVPREADRILPKYNMELSAVCLVLSG